MYPYLKYIFADLKMTLKLQALAARVHQCPGLVIQIQLLQILKSLATLTTLGTLGRHTQGVVLLGANIGAIWCPHHWV